MEVNVSKFQDCLNVKSREERVVYKRLNSANADSENNQGGSSKKVCTTSAETFIRKRSVIASKT
jgi:hypothetical protein